MREINRIAEHVNYGQWTQTVRIRDGNWPILRSLAVFFALCCCCIHRSAGKLGQRDQETFADTEYSGSDGTHIFGQNRPTLTSHLRLYSIHSPWHILLNYSSHVCEWKRDIRQLYQICFRVFDQGFFSFNTLCKSVFSGIMDLMCRSILWWKVAVLKWFCWVNVFWQ